MYALLPLLLLLAACVKPQVGTTTTSQVAADVREVILQVTNGSRRPLDVPRPDLIEDIARLRGGSVAPFSPTDAFTAAASIELEKRGVRTRTNHAPDLPVFHITLDDLEIRDSASAGAVAFVSARYVLVDAKGESLWETVEKRFPIGLGGPDLTNSVLARIAREAIRHALSSFPVPPSS